jgi:hypothetical protein
LSGKKRGKKSSQDSQALFKIQTMRIFSAVTMPTDLITNNPLAAMSKQAVKKLRMLGLPRAYLWCPMIRIHQPTAYQISRPIPKT